MNGKTVAEVKDHLEEYIRDVILKKERIILHQDIIPVAAIIPFEDLKFLEDIEDLIDIQDAKKAIEEYDRTGEAVTLDELKQELGM